MITEYNFGWVFFLAALLIMILVMDIVWWQAFLVLLLSHVSLKFQTKTNYRRIS